MPDTAIVDEEVDVKVHLETDLNECMVVKAQLRSTIPTDTSFNVKQTVCLCPDNARNLYWSFTASESMYVIAYVDAVSETGICPYDRAVKPIWGASNSAVQKITVTQ
ncbi:prolactin-inducible protein homolog [Suncus etruscus]|uniref:prolactin-inducible protein homolog n=1 Tax=Suncus etruscus TaxID=109475 RepID=UPI002110B408|nr:prolactin-inducible protein homolog [Suncus etruscus]